MKFADPKRIAPVESADDRLGVVFERPTVLRARGWGRLAYFEPIQD